MTPLYRRTLGGAWDDLAPQVRELHSVTGESVFVGRCRVDRGRNPLSMLVAALIGLPTAGEDQPVVVTLTVEDDGERWVRQIGARRFWSMQRPGGASGSERLISERFGFISVDFALDVGPSTLRYVLRRWTLFGIPLPLALGPRSRASECVEDGKFRFDVEIRHPLTGLIVHYRGQLSPK